MTQADPLLSPLSTLKGIGPQTQKKLSALDITTWRDLLFCFPADYVDLTRITALRDCLPGGHNQVLVQILDSRVIYPRYRGRQKPMFRVLADDGSGRIHLHFFHFYAAQSKNLQPGRWVLCHGNIRQGKQGLEMVHPVYRIHDDPGGADTTPQTPPWLPDTLSPRYPSREGIGATLMQKSIEQILGKLDDGITELLPHWLLEKYQLPPLPASLNMLHHPPPDIPMQQLEQKNHPAQLRLALEELVAHHLQYRKLHQARRRMKAAVLPLPGTRIEPCLPFTLTGAQQRCIRQIEEDLSGGRPMLRLLLGDVGSGKTVVAAAAMLQAVSHGFQAVLMAPTEILAEQHYRNLCRWFRDFPYRIELLTGSLPAAEKSRRQACIEQGQAHICVGTHALFQKKVRFRQLALVVIDEQHRFGVQQRKALLAKGRGGESLFPHQLVMTATPIPRTLAMTLYGEFDLSFLDQQPPGRRPVQTVVLAEDRRLEVVRRIQHQLQQPKQQAYWVCPYIDSEEQNRRNVETSYGDLLEHFNGKQLAFLHGRMKPAEKQAVLDGFSRGDIRLLVATTVIEVGVDVPGASLMVIENAETLGLAQLHQLRGRIGRGDQDSVCILIYKTPLTPVAKKRLQVIREHHQGFEIARRDLELRGPGELLGHRQTGEVNFRMADFRHHGHLIEDATECARQLMAQQPGHAEALMRRWFQQQQVAADV